MIFGVGLPEARHSSLMAAPLDTSTRGDGAIKSIFGGSVNKTIEGFHFYFYFSCYSTITTVEIKNKKSSGIQNYDFILEMFSFFKI